jgi:hypothetical protein
MKTRKEQFPILEQHLVEWVDRANSVRMYIHILVTGTVLRAATTKLIQKLIDTGIPTNKEDYTGFTWQARVCTVRPCYTRPRYTGYLAVSDGARSEVSRTPKSTPL